MYAAGTSSNTDRPGWFADELAVIEQLCHATQTAGWRLLIKPKPNGRRDEFARFVHSFEHVTTGAYGNASDAVDYDLDDHYNRTRLAELSSCDLVINAVTTFALDAAVAGLPVMQLDLRDDPSFVALGAAMRNHHIATHLLGSPHIVSTGRGRPLREAVAEALAHPTDGPERFSAALREWVLPPRSLDDAVRSVLDTLEQGR